MPSKSGRQAGPKLALLERLVRSGQLTRTDNDGWMIRDAALHDLFEVLADEADLQLLPNNKITGDDYLVSGHLDGQGGPLQKIAKLGSMYGVTCFVADGAFYPIEKGGKLPYPDVQWTFQPRYLKIRDSDQARQLIEPILSETGSFDFDPGTGTLTVSDSYIPVSRTEALLLAIDKPKGRVSMDVQIVNVSGSESPREMETALSSVLGFDHLTDQARVDGSGLQQHHFQPSQLDGALRTLGSRGQLERISNQTMATEDNEQVSCSFSLRHSSGQEGGIAVTPTLLPDGTVRMRVRSHSLTTEAEPDTVTEVVARVPDGQALVVRGALGQDENSNLVMILTPTALPPEVDEASAAPRSSTLPNPLLALQNQ